MGLLGDGWNDPQSAATMALAGSMVRGDFGGGLLGANQAYQGTLDAQMKRQLMQAQTGDTNSQVQLRQLQLEQARQQWALQQPLLQRLIGSMQGGQPASMQTPASQIPAGQPATMPSAGGSMGSGTFGIPVGGQPAAAAQAGAPQGPRSASMLPGVPDNLTQWAIATGGIGAVPGLLEKFNQPTDIQKLLTARGIDPGSPEGQAAIGAQIEKQNYIPPTALRTPIYFDPVSRTTKVVPTDQLAAGYGAQFEAEARGKGNIASKQVWDPTANAGKGGYVFRTESQIADATNPAATTPAPASLPVAASGASAPLRNNNPGALMPGGKLANFSTPEQGLAALDANLLSYGKSGVNTVAGVISKWAPPSENDTASYVRDVTQRLGVPPTQRVDLSNPVQRHALATAILLHENGPSAVFAAPAASAGPLLAQPPLGQPQRTEAAQKAGADAMTASYGGLQKVRSNGQSALDDLDHMLTLGSGKSFLAAGPIGDHVLPNIPFFGTNAKEYEKDRDNLVTMIASQTGMDTDAARSLVYGSVPNYGAPKDAITHGLQIVKNQISARMLKANLLTPYFNQGNADTYNQLENSFDQAVKPTLMPQITPLLAMPAGPQRAAALKRAAFDPNMRQALEVLAQGGAFK